MSAIPSISWDAFGRLRLSQFVAAKRIRPLEDWDFMERIWVGEAAGFSEWLRLADDPEVLRSLALDLANLEGDAVAAVLERLGLPLRHAMTRDEVVRILGEPTKVESFPRAKDRETLIYAPTPSGRYHLSCTVQQAAGLTYLVVMRDDVAPTS
jgi:hypothetical protein